MQSLPPSPPHSPDGSLKPSSTNYLITGANRGLGLGLTSALLQRPDTVVVAAVRDPDHRDAFDFSSLSTAPGSRVLVVKIDSQSQTDPFTAAQQLQTVHNISHLDVVIANAGIGKYYGPTVTTPIAEFQSHLQVNAIAPMTLFQALWPLLQRAHSTPKFIAISSRLASIEQLDFWASLPGDALGSYMPAAPYGSSKACLNYLLRRLHFEHENLIAFPLSPGWVQTEQGDIGAAQRGMKKAPVTIDDSVSGMLDKIDNATKQDTSGRFLSFDDAEYQW